MSGCQSRVQRGSQCVTHTHTLLNTHTLINAADVTHARPQHAAQLSSKTSSSFLQTSSKHQSRARYMCRAGGCWHAVNNSSPKVEDQSFSLCLSRILESTPAAGLCESSLHRHTSPEMCLFKSEKEKERSKITRVRASFCVISQELSSETVITCCCRNIYLSAGEISENHAAETTGVCVCVCHWITITKGVSLPSLVATTVISSSCYFFLLLLLLLLLHRKPFQCTCLEKAAFLLILLAAVTKRNLRKNWLPLRHLL